jgi:hypothetical protein
MAPEPKKKRPRTPPKRPIIGKEGQKTSMNHFAVAF